MGLIATETEGTPPETEALYRAHGAAVARLCRSLLRDRDEAEDATQQVFLSVHRALLNGAAPREPLPWLLAVARNECYARFRQRPAAPVAAAGEADGAAADASVHVLRAGELAELWNEVGQMPAAQREAFLLREIRGLSYGQLAHELSLSPPSVRSLLLRARSRLRRRLVDAAAGLGGAPWIQTFVRLVAGGEGASPVPAAAKAAAVGVGALALAGGGGLVARHVARKAGHTAAPSPARGTHLQHGAVPDAVAVTSHPAGDRPVHRVVVPAHPRRRSGSATDGSGREHRSGGAPSEGAHSGQSGSSGDDSSPSARSSSGSGRHGSDDTPDVPEQSREGGSSGGGSSDTATSSGSTSSASSTSGSDDGGSSGSTSGSDGESATATTVTSSEPDTGGGSGDSGASDGESGSGGGTGSDG